MDLVLQIYVLDLELSQTGPKQRINLGWINLLETKYILYVRTNVLGNAIIHWINTFKKIRIIITNQGGLL